MPVVCLHAQFRPQRASSCFLHGRRRGNRPALVSMSERLASAGFIVLLPDLFYRYGSYGPLDPKELFKGDFRAILSPLVTTTGNTKAAVDRLLLPTFCIQREPWLKAAVADIADEQGAHRHPRKLSYIHRRRRRLPVTRGTVPIRSPYALRGLWRHQYRLPGNERYSRCSCDLAGFARHEGCRSLCK